VLDRSLIGVNTLASVLSGVPALAFFLDRLGHTGW
jgi:hypothetical protein